MLVLQLFKLVLRAIVQCYRPVQFFGIQQVLLMTNDEIYAIPLQLLKDQVY